MKRQCFSLILFYAVLSSSRHYSLLYFAYLLNDELQCICTGEVMNVNTSRLLLCEATANVMKQGFTILGLSTVERM